jgi:CYTH domain-containing protein
MIQIQPCDWQDTDVNFKYTVDVYGRTIEKEVVRVRITGFQPYFYLKSCEGEAQRNFDRQSRTPAKNVSLI